MADAVRMLTTEFDGDDGLIVTFSDGTTGAYAGRGIARVEAVSRTSENQDSYQDSD